MPQGNYANINGLKIYYEVHGAGRPLVLLHGGFMNIAGLGPLLPALAENRQVVAVELEGHGHTADLDRPISIAQMADDTAGLLEHLDIPRADVFGYSLGGVTALRLAIRYPALVRRLVLVSAPFNNQGYYPAIAATWPSISVQSFAGTPVEQVYTQSAPHPEHFPVFVEKMKQAMISFPGWPPAEIRSIQAPALVMAGDTDLIRPEHFVELFRLLGGGKEDGGMGELPKSQLAILPGTTHFTIIARLDLLLPVVRPYLDAV